MNCVYFIHNCQLSLLLNDYILLFYALFFINDKRTFRNFVVKRNKNKKLKENDGMFAHINQTNIFFDVDGQHVEVKDGKIIKKPVILVVHGGPGGTHLNFKPHLDSLTACAQLIYIDQRGCGFSDESDTDLYTLEQNVEDIEALRKHLGLEKIWVLGHSYGGMVAMSYALKYQKYINELLLMATSPSHRFLEKAKKYVEEHGNKAQKYYAEKLWEGSFQSEEEVEEYYKVMQPLYSIKSSNNDQKKPYVKRAYRVLNKG